MTQDKLPAELSPMQFLAAVAFWVHPWKTTVEIEKKLGLPNKLGSYVHYLSVTKVIQFQGNGNGPGEVSQVKIRPAYRKSNSLYGRSAFAELSRLFGDYRFEIGQTYDLREVVRLFHERYPQGYLALREDPPEDLFRNCFSILEAHIQTTEQVLFELKELRQKLRHLTVTGSEEVS